MSPHTTSLAPEFDVTVHIALDDFGKAGRAYRETAEEAANFDSVVDDLMRGQFNNPVRVIAFNTSEGWSRDVSEDVARELREEEIGSFPRCWSGHRYGHCWPRLGTFTVINEEVINKLETEYGKVVNAENRGFTRAKGEIQQYVETLQRRAEAIAGAQQQPPAASSDGGAAPPDGAGIAQAPAALLFPHNVAIRSVITITETRFFTVRSRFKACAIAPAAWRYSPRSAMFAWRAVQSIDASPRSF